MARVLLVDTVTENTDMRGTDLENLNNISTGEVRTEMDASLTDMDVATESKADENMGELHLHITAMNN